MRAARQSSKMRRGGLAGAGITASMSRKAVCYDKASMESLFRTLTELVRRRNHKTRADAQRINFHRGLLQPEPGSIAQAIYRPIEMELKAA
ncbi:hypothetical protein QA640_40045 [Bradyrhizobium sp. CB82]|uniref:hypothetical protein n=1 Tax=Bradyrhizobium sp. CB82 TaxID=3039159 RepID=UPI0024B27765|nr:hypothetical protein [Bradyrhizobium sp. CB82]WFU40311.1 hypothetical protein QA640_40045 [Bradyrhizobium sp. CB82]